MLRNTLKKKGELTFTQIVGAVLALFVLVIVLVIFGNNFNIIGNDLAQCSSKGGTCVEEGQCKGIPKAGEFGDCVGTKPVCCFQVTMTTINKDE
ncbi:hypothetical protein N9934_01110 [Desulfosarcina sp.]|nr:hypothetical protein [Desulfosarcina sp.]